MWLYNVDTDRCRLELKKHLTDKVDVRLETLLSVFSAAIVSSLAFTSEDYVVNKKKIGPSGVEIHTTQHLKPVLEPIYMLFLH